MVCLIQLASSARETAPENEAVKPIKNSSRVKAIFTSSGFGTRHSNAGLILADPCASPKTKSPTKNNRLVPRPSTLLVRQKLRLTYRDANSDAVLATPFFSTATGFVTQQVVRVSQLVSHFGW